MCVSSCKICLIHHQFQTSGLNCRKFHSFHTEDFIGRIKQCCAASKQQDLEHMAILRWYTGPFVWICYLISLCDLHKFQNLIPKEVTVCFPPINPHLRLTNKGQMAQFDCRVAPWKWSWRSWGLNEQRVWQIWGKMGLITKKNHQINKPWNRVIFQKFLRMVSGTNSFS